MNGPAALNRPNHRRRCNYRALGAACLSVLVSCHYEPTPRDRALDAEARYNKMKAESAIAGALCLQARNVRLAYQHAGDKAQVHEWQFEEDVRCNDERIDELTRRMKALGMIPSDR